MGDLVHISFEGTGELQPDGSMGIIGTVKTRPVTAKPTNLRTTDVQQTTAALAWDELDGSSWSVYRNAVKIATVYSGAYADSGLTNNTDYTYTVEAQSIGGTSPLSDALVVHTASPAGPSAPANLRLSQRSYNSIQLDWDSAPGVVWDVTRNGGSVATGLTSPSHTSSGLAANTSYDFDVFARAGASSSTAAEITVSTLQNFPPVWQGIPAQSGGVGNTVSLDLRPMVDDQESDAALVFSVQSGSLPPGLSLNSNGVISGTLTSAGTYAASIGAYDGLSTVTTPLDWDVAAAADVTPPSVPASPSASANGSTVTLTWTPSTDASGILNYDVYRSSGGINYGLYATTSGPPFIDSNVPNGDRYYKVLARDNSQAQNVSALSAAAFVNVNVAPPGPDTPINFIATAVSSARIDMTWQAGPTGSAPTDYDIDFSTVGPSGPWTGLPVTGTGLSFSHTGLSVQQYWYRLRANSGAVSSGYATATATPLGGSQAADFIIGGSAGTFDFRSATDVNGVTRKVLPGEIVQCAARSASSSSSILRLLYPEGTFNQRIILIPPANAQVIFQMTNPGTSGFMVTVEGPQGNSVAVADRTRYGYLTIDGSTTGASVPTEPVSGRKYGFRWKGSVNNPGNQNMTNALKGRGFINYLTLKRCHMDLGNTNVGHGGFSPNENTFLRSVYPGTYRHGARVTECMFDKTDTYMGSNYAPGLLPHKDYVIDSTYFINAPQTPILIKNGWYGGDEVHHNIVVTTGMDKTGNAVQRNGASMTSCADSSFHHNWIENTADGIPGLSKNQAHALRFDNNDGPPRVAAQGHPGFSFFRIRIYDNVIIRGPEMGIRINASASVADGGYTTAEIGWYRAEIFNNTVDDFDDYGISFGTVDSQSFCRNNIVTRTGGLQGMQGSDASKNFVSSSISGVYANVYTPAGQSAYNAASASQKNYHLAAARAVHGTSVLDTDVATSDYDGDIISSVSGADMGAFQYP